MHSITLPIDSETVLQDIAWAVHGHAYLEISAYDTFAKHEQYPTVMNKLAELVFKQLSDELVATCKQFGFEPVTFTNPTFDPKEDRFCANSDTDKETLSALVFTKYWPLAVESSKQWLFGDDDEINDETADDSSDDTVMDDLVNPPPLSTSFRSGGFLGNVLA